METENTSLEKVNNWIRNSVMLKLATITFLVLLLLIPGSMIQSIIEEREILNTETTTEVSSKWANRQVLTGPVLTIPVVYLFIKDDKATETTRYWHILPADLQVKGSVFPQKLKRGIYEVVVYKSSLSTKGAFVIDQQPDEAGLKEILWSQAFLTIGVSDLRGIEDDVAVKWAGVDLKVEPGSKIDYLAYSGFTVNLPDLAASKDKVLAFGFDLQLQGSQNLSFIPVGSNTNVDITSTWPSPSFNGNFIPDVRDVSDKGFTAQWKILQLNRNFPQSWMGTAMENKLNESVFGVDLIMPVDDYQKSIRSSKYAIMTIVLTFLIFFLVEILNKRKIHPFQYTLVGLALSLFYILLISVSEHLSFNEAYAISTCAVVGMISLYSMSVFKMPKLSMLLVATLIAIYSFLFVTLQLADYALLMGSIGLTTILAATMYFTRNINWYKLNITND